MTRVISGLAGGRKLAVPRTGVRPTGDKARGALFNSLASMLDLEGAAVLDLYAGSGALGLEALSRGARSVLFVENGGGVLPVLRANLATVGLPGGRVQAESVPTVVAGPAPEACGGFEIAADQFPDEGRWFRGNGFGVGPQR